MWFQTLKTRQAVRHFTSSNSQGLVVGLEYSDKKSEVYTLKREIPPLSLEDGATLAFVSCEGSGMFLVAAAVSSKGKQMLELKAWDMMSSLGFTAKELTVQDSQKSTVNESKFKAIVSLPEASGTQQYNLKIDSFKDFLVLSSGTGLIFLWKCKKADVCISFELQAVIKTSVAVLDVCLIFTDSSKKGAVSVVVGEPGGVRLFTPAKIDASQTESANTERDIKFFSSPIPFPPADMGNYVQEIQRSSPTSCILSDSTGQLWFLNPPRFNEVILPSSRGGHGLFAVHYHNGDGRLATIEKGQTVNMYKLSEIVKNADSGLISQPWHVFFSGATLSSICFMEENVLVAGSHTNRTISLWVGLDTISS